MKKIERECGFCGKKTMKTKSECSYSTSGLVYCTSECFHNHRNAQSAIKKENRKCQECGSVIPHEGKKFCTHACSAKASNRQSPKRCKTKKCKTCEALVISQRTYCGECYKNYTLSLQRAKIDKKCERCPTLIPSSRRCCKQCVKEKKEQRHNETISKSIREMIGDRKDAGKFQPVRNYAKKVVKDWPRVCKICGYDLHVDVCHIKPISKFDLSTPIKEVNDPANLMLLCRTHHWEMDHKIGEWSR